MFEKLPESSGDLIGFKAAGKLTDDDYKILVPQLEALIQDVGSIRILVLFEDFQGWDLKAAWDDFAFGVKHRSDIKRIAIVGETHWEEWLTKLSKPFVKGQVQFFEKPRLAEAWDWLREVP